MGGGAPGWPAERVSWLHGASAPDADRKNNDTRETVTHALQNQIPVIAVGLRGENLTRIDVLRSTADLHHPLSEPRESETTTNASKPDWHEALKTALCSILLFPDGEKPSKTGHQESGHPCQAEESHYDRRAVFTTYREPASLDALRTGSLWKWFEKLTKSRTLQTPILRKWSHTLSLAFGWTAVLEPQRGEPFLPTSGLDSTYKKIYQTARERAASGGLSGVFGNGHRGGILASYLLAAIAVSLSLIGGLLHFHDAPPLVIAGLTVIELEWFTLLICVGAPAFMAALHGFASQIENERLRQRSASMTVLLKERMQVVKALDLSDPDSAEAVWGFNSEALNAAALILLSEALPILQRFARVVSLVANALRKQRNQST